MFKKVSICISVILVACLFIIGIYIDKNSKYSNLPTQKENTFAIGLIPFEQEQYLVNSVIIEWLDGEYTAEQLYDLYRNKSGRLDYPTPVRINFSIDNIPNGETLSSLTVELSENESFNNTKEYKLKSHERDISIYNLKTGQKYYYRVTATTSSGKQTTASSYFSTAQTPRLILVDGLRNVRDIGGYKTVDGKTVKQGLLFRGTELRGTMNPDFTITEAGIDVLLNDLEIRNELDLRFTTDGGETISDKVEQKFYKFKYLYSEIFLSEGKEAVKTLFSDLAIKETYPAYLHCTYGSDRTGTICYLLQALLGVSEEDCYRNWELTTFFNGGSYKDDALKFMENMKKFDGNTLQEKTENFLLSTGLTASEIESIKDIFLE
ncbi:MAG: tyrosine-protein phosphatase [Clostridia bacterium]|nr:tyrosine-protein phosphatase [Clostridia bacterium]